MIREVAIIPTIIKNDIPLPIPLSVIFSPNHMAKIVPVTEYITEEMMNKGPLPKIKCTFRNTQST